MSKIQKHYEVVEPLDHDGKHYAPGSNVELTEEEAKPLKEMGVVSSGSTAPVAPAKTVREVEQK